MCNICRILPLNKKKEHLFIVHNKNSIVFNHDTNVYKLDTKLQYGNFGCKFPRVSLVLRVSTLFQTA